MSKKISQVEKIYGILKDHHWHSTQEISDLVYHGSPMAAIAQRISNIRAKHNIEIECEPDSKIRPDISQHGLWWYRIKPPARQMTLPMEEF